MTFRDEYFITIGGVRLTKPPAVSFARDGSKTLHVTITWNDGKRLDKAGIPVVVEAIGGALIGRSSRKSRRTRKVIQ